MTALWSEKGRDYYQHLQAKKTAPASYFFCKEVATPVSKF
jgi:hypothetical protein